MLAAISGLKPEDMIAEGDSWQHLKFTIEKNRIDLIVVERDGVPVRRSFFLGEGGGNFPRSAVLTVGRNVRPAPRRARNVARFFSRQISAPHRRVRQCRPSL